VLTQAIMQQQRLPQDITENKTLDIYPNPANQFVVVYNYTKETRTASLFDLNGRLVQQHQLTQSSTRINTASLAPGMYILKITNAKSNTLRTEKILISH
jgi:hypothetical protein